MLRKIMVITLAVLVLGSFGPLAFGADSAGGKPQCTCPKGCQCEHCRTGKGRCQWMTGEKCCTCPQDCQCEHCRTGQGTCLCNTDGKGCACCPKGCRTRTPGADAEQAPLPSPTNRRSSPRGDASRSPTPRNRPLSR